MSRINLGRRGTRVKLSTLDTAHKPSPTAWKGLSPGQKGPHSSHRNHQQPPQTGKADTNGNHRLCPKSKPQTKCHWSSPAGQTPQGEVHTQADPSTLDTDRTLERAKSQPQRQESNTNPHRPGGPIPNYQKQLSTNIFEIAFLQTFAIFWGKYLWWSLFLLKFFTKVFTKLFY